MLENENKTIPNDKIKSDKKPNVPNLRFVKYTEPIKLWRCSDFLKTFPTNSLSWDQLSYIEKSDFKNLHYGLIHNGAPTLINCEEYELPFVQSKIKNYTLCKDGDIIFTDASEDTKDICKPVEFTNTINNKIVSGLHTIHARDTKEITITGFKGYLFSSYNFHKQIHRLTQGTKIFSINPGNFKEVFVGIPSADEQKDIVSLFSKIDKRIISQSKIIEDLKLLEKSIYNHIFMRLNKYEKIILEDIIVDYNKKTTTDNEYPILSSTLSGLYLQEKYFKKQTASTSTEGYKIVPYGYATYRSMSDTGQFRFNLQNFIEYGIVSPAYPVFTCYKNQRLDFILLCLNYYEDIKKQLFIMKQGGTRFALHFNSLCKLKIPKVDKEEQTKIMNFVTSLNNKIILEEKILKKYKEQKKYLLSNMFI